MKSYHEMTALELRALLRTAQAEDVIDALLWAAGDGKRLTREAAMACLTTAVEQFEGTGGNREMLVALVTGSFDRFRESRLENAS